MWLAADLPNHTLHSPETVAHGLRTYVEHSPFLYVNRNDWLGDWLREHSPPGLDLHPDLPIFNQRRYLGLVPLALCVAGWGLARSDFMLRRWFQTFLLLFVFQYWMSIGPQTLVWQMARSFHWPDDRRRPAPRAAHRRRGRVPRLGRCSSAGGAAIPTRCRSPASSWRSAWRSRSSSPRTRCSASSTRRSPFSAACARPDTSSTSRHSRSTPCSAWRSPRACAGSRPASGPRWSRRSGCARRRLPPDARGVPPAPRRRRPSRRCGGRSTRSRVRTGRCASRSSPRTPRRARAWSPPSPTPAARGRGSPGRRDATGSRTPARDGVARARHRRSRAGARAPHRGRAHAQRPPGVPARGVRRRPAAPRRAAVDGVVERTPFALWQAARPADGDRVRLLRAPRRRHEWDQAVSIADAFEHGVVTVAGGERLADSTEDTVAAAGAIRAVGAALEDPASRALAARHAAAVLSPRPDRGDALAGVPRGAAPRAADGGALRASRAGTDCLRRRRRRGARASCSSARRIIPGGRRASTAPPPRCCARSSRSWRCGCRAGAHRVELELRRHRCW